MRGLVSNQSCVPIRSFSRLTKCISLAWAWPIPDRCFWEVQPDSAAPELTPTNALNHSRRVIPQSFVDLTNRRLSGKRVLAEYSHASRPLGNCIPSALSTPFPKKGTIKSGCECAFAPRCFISLTPHLWRCTRSSWIEPFQFKGLSPPPLLIATILTRPKGTCGFLPDRPSANSGSNPPL